jgi:hypothetical protein
LHLLFYDERAATRLGAEHMGKVICAPTQVIHVCEALHDAGLLSRRETTQVQEQVLARTDAHGHWR